MFTGINVLSQTYFLKNSDVTIQKRNDNKNSAARKFCKLSKAFSHLQLFDSYFYRIIRDLKILVRGRERVRDLTARF